MYASWRRAPAGSATGSVPFTRTLPLAGFTNPRKRLSVVVLPAPLAPSSA
jgi:hypothetical protein